MTEIMRSILYGQVEGKSIDILPVAVIPHQLSPSNSPNKKPKPQKRNIVMETIKKTIHAVVGDTEDYAKSISSTAVIKPGDRVLLTGATGFVAGHILNSLLNAGFKVKATVHSKEKADRLIEIYGQRGGDLEVVVVEDIAKDGSFDEAVKGVAGVIHAAYPHVLARDGNKELLDQAISGAVGILDSIVEHNPDVKRVVLTSSFGAMNDQHKGNWPGHTYSEVDWNPIKHEEALRTSDPTTAYCASKTLAERAAWDFVSNHIESKSPRPAKFTLASVLLPAVVGPIAHDLTTTGFINNSVADIYRLISGCENKVPMNTLWAWADVRDVADTHIAALMADKKEPGVEDRYFAAAGTYDYNEICKIIERRFPELVREGGTPHSTDPSETPYHYKVENKKVKDELGIKMRGLEESIVDTVKSLLDYEERTKRGETKEVILTPVVTSRGDKGKGPERIKTAENSPYSIGKGKTACRCGGKSGQCTCPPETCACEGCAKKTEQQKTQQQKTDEKVAKEGENMARKVTAEVSKQKAGEKTRGKREVGKKAAGKAGPEESVEKAKTTERAQENPSTKYGKLSGKIDCDCGKGENACTCPPETCSCRGCAKKMADKSKYKRGDFGNRPVSVGEGKTACRCGGNDKTCTCPPETCACNGCQKKIANMPKETVQLNKPKEGKMIGST